MIVNGQSIETQIIRHSDIDTGGELLFKMNETPTAWGTVPDANSSVGGNSHWLRRGLSRLGRIWTLLLRG